jgi:hypothetical protein
MLYGCSSENLTMSNRLYEQVESEPNVTRQIELLEESNSLCYAPELEMSIWMLKAEIESSNLLKIEYYLESIGTLNDFSDEVESQKYLNIFNCRLAKLYKPINQEVSKYYQEQVVGACGEEEKSKRFKYGFLFFVSLLFGVVIWLLFFYKTY